MLLHPRVPAHHSSTLTDYLLTHSEYFFPPLNGACTLTNLALTITAYLHRDSNGAAAAKLPYLGASLVLNLATTAYALGVMVPMNKAMGGLARTLERDEGDEKSAKELRRLQKRWLGLNYGEFCLFFFGSVFFWCCLWFWVDCF